MSHTSTYDAVPYVSNAIAECDPLRMATIAALFGLDSVDPAACDVLDLGCGDAINLMALAVAQPGIRAVGFDPAAKAIERGEMRRRRAGIENLTLLSEIEDGALDGSADYVIAHGVLSWVDDEVREQVIASAARAARPGALVSFSYRALPNGHYESVARAIAREGVATANERAAASGRPPLDPREQAAVAIERLRLVAEGAGPKTAHGQQLTRAADRYAGFHPDYLFHDILADVAEPFRVTQVDAWCAAHGLQYVGELIPSQLWQYRLPPDLAAEVRNLASPTAVGRQQLVDDLINTGFHSSLFVKAGEPPQLEPSLAGLTFHVRQAPGTTPNAAERADEIDAAIAQVIREQGAAASITTAEIAARLGRDVAEVDALVMAMYTHDVARISTTPPPVPTEPGERPQASPLVVEQIRDGESLVTTRFHRPLRHESPIHCVLIGLLDGTRDREAIRRELPGAAAAAGVSLGLPEVLLNLDQQLQIAASVGVLMPPSED